MNVFFGLSALPVIALLVLLIFSMVALPGVVRWFPAQADRFTRCLFALAFLCAVVTMGLVFFHGPIQVSLFALPTPFTITPFGFFVDRLSAVLILLIVLVSGVVHLYALMAMREETHFPRFVFLLSLATVNVLLVVLANNLLLLCFFWILKGITLTFLLSHYHERPASWNAAFAKLKVDLIGDLAWLQALFLIWHLFATFDLVTITHDLTWAHQALASYSLNLLTLLSSLLLVAAMTKSAQFPFHFWLPETLEAPTPVSALMHAGLINAGGFLFIRLSPLFFATPLTMALAVTVGLFTALYGTTLMLIRTDVKGKLVYSTMGQMGFMILECGLGMVSLATLHLVAHGIFKATAFLGSGRAIEQKRHGLFSHATPVRSLSRLRFIVLNLLTASLFFVLPAFLGFPFVEWLLLTFVWITALHAALQFNMHLHLSFLWLDLGLVVVSVLYLLFIHTLEGFFMPVVLSGSVVSAGLLIFLCLVLSAGGIVSAWLICFPDARWTRFTKTLYPLLLFLSARR